MMKLKHGMVLNLVVVSLLVPLTSAIIIGTDHSAERFEEVNNHTVPEILALNSAKAAMLQMTISAHALTIDTDSDDEALDRWELEQASQALVKSGLTLKSDADEDEREAYRGLDVAALDFRCAITSYLAGYQGHVTGGSQPDASEVQRLRNAIRTAQDRLTHSLDEHLKREMLELEVRREEAVAGAEDRARIGMTISAAAFVLALSIGLVASRALARGITDLSNAAMRYGQGDLEHIPEVKGAEELMSLGRTMGDMAKSLLESDRALKKALKAAETANTAKSEFLANMSHEIRTPLTAILGYADLLAEGGSAGGPPSGQAETIATIRNAGKHLMAIISDILDLSRIEADRVEVEHVETLLPKMLRNIESLLRPRAAGKGVLLHTVLATAVPEKIMGDPTRLRQILMNLVGNAIKFTESGSVTITASSVDAPAGPRLVIDIEDTGPGMDPAQAERLFSAFGQADSSVTRKFGGTGLGLIISRRLANLMGGDVKLLRTAPGTGSCFRLVLPLETAAGSAVVTSMDSIRTVEAPAVAAAPVPLKGRIMLAEDGPDNQRLISFHLRKAGAEVEVADNGRIALLKLEMAEAAGKPFDLLVSDMQMPEMDGYTLARTLRERGSTLAIVALTAHAMSQDRDRCMAAGCDDYATKPIDKARLLATCAAWMGRPSGKAAGATAGA